MLFAQEYNALEGAYMWSDTGSFIKDSPGDVTISRNPDRWNLSDWTNA